MTRKRYPYRDYDDFDPPGHPTYEGGGGIHADAGFCLRCNSLAEPDSDYCFVCEEVLRERDPRRNPGRGRGRVPVRRIQRLVKELAKQNWTTERKRKGWKVTPPGEGRPIFLHGSANVQTYKNNLAKLKRLGFEPSSKTKVAGANPGVYRNSSAKAHYREFHGSEPDNVETKNMWVPGGLVEVGRGDAIDVGYEIGSRDSSKGHNNLYVHDFGGSVKIYRKAKKNETPDKVYKNFPKECMVLGYNIGFSYKDNNGDLKEVKGSRRKKLAAPNKRTLVVIGPKGVEYLMQGGAMHIDDWIRR